MQVKIHHPLTEDGRTLFKEDRKKCIEVPAHWHDCIEVLYMIKGSCFQWINGTYIECMENDVITLRAGDIHKITCKPEEDVEILVIKFFPQLIATGCADYRELSYFFLFLNKRTKIYNLIHSSEESKQISEILNRIYSEFTNKRNAYKIILRGMITELMGYLLRIGVLEDYSRFEQKLNSLDSIQPLLKYLEKNFKEDISLKDAAKMLNMNYFYVGRYFKNVTGRNFKEYLDYIRVCEGEKLIIEKGLNVTEAAYESGFNNVSSFQ